MKGLDTWVLPKISFMCSLLVVGVLLPQMAESMQEIWYYQYVLKHLQTLSVSSTNMKDYTLKQYSCSLLLYCGVCFANCYEFSCSNVLHKWICGWFSYLTSGVSCRALAGIFLFVGKWSWLCQLNKWGCRQSTARSCSTTRVGIFCVI